MASGEILDFTMYDDDIVFLNLGRTRDEYVIISQYNVSSYMLIYVNFVSTGPMDKR